MLTEPKKILKEAIMANLTIVAKIIVMPEHADFVKEEMLKLITPTTQEKGCVYYNLHQDNEDSRAFIWVEAWETKEDWHAHNNSAHIQAYRAATGEFVEDRIIYQMTQIG